MPNWCYNTAIIHCPSNEIYDRLLSSMMEDTWFEDFAPIDTYDIGKALENWNTKSTPQQLDIIIEDAEKNTIEVNFNTAWNPPTGVYKKMYKNYGIETTAYYEESGNAFFGECKYSNEEVNNMYDYPTNKEELDEVRESICSELDDFMYPIWERLESEWEEDT